MNTITWHIQKNPGVIYEHEFIHSTMGKWDDHDIVTKIFRGRDI